MDANDAEEGSHSCFPSDRHSECSWLPLSVSLLQKDLALHKVSLSHLDPSAASEGTPGRSLTSEVLRELLLLPDVASSFTLGSEFPFPAYECSDKTESRNSQTGKSPTTLLQTVVRHGGCSLAFIQDSSTWSSRVLRHEVGMARILVRIFIPTVIGALIITVASLCLSGPRQRGWTVNARTMMTWISYTLINWGMVYTASALVLASSDSMKAAMPLGGSLVIIYQLSLTSSLAAFVPWTDPQEKLKWRNDPEFLKNIAVVIPCHRSEDGVMGPLRSYLKYFKPEQLIFVDNSNDLTPPDQLKSIVHGMSPLIKYIYVPEGRKSQALHVGVNAMSAYKYVLLVDDDTEIPDNMVFDESYFLSNPRCAGVGWPRHISQHNLLTRIADMQLKSDNAQFIHALSYALASTTNFLLGTMALYRRDFWLDIMEDHPCTPYGEDRFTGAVALTKGYSLAFDLRSCCITYSPPVLCGMCNSFDRVQGYGAATLFKQRALRWYCNQMRSLPFDVHNWMWYRTGDLLQGTLYRIWFFLYLLRKPLLVCLVAVTLLQPTLLPRQLAMMYVLKLADRMSLNYILWYGSGHQASLFTVLMTPFVDIFLQGCTLVGAIKCLTYDIWHPTYSWRVRCWEKYSHLTPEPVESSEKVSDSDHDLSTNAASESDVETTLPTGRSCISTHRSSSSTNTIN
eukprot:CAMPEP_0178388810 /NCGR_PEP_ID=MMETSP0689_2-20121128/9787_1 /TAXON_ID=160604 /ORGANISM="Amphidinium massartii, Strain CS-259" /LENGTH=680 /DNA_ID=CAMNT_0020009229 /DNA_START=89 /DNA_END=2131 /DNA_ORIENTATION=+